MAHESFLRHAHFRWLKIAVLTSLVVAAGFAATLVMRGYQLRHTGDSWFGYLSGTLGAGLIVWLALLGVRKRHMTDGVWSLKAWVSAHVYLGLSLIVIATLHSGLQFGWNIHTLSYVLMMFVIVSGLFGIYSYARYPRLITANRMAATQAQMLGQIAAIDGEIRQAILTMDDAVVKLVAPAIERDAIGGGVWRQLSGRYPDCPTAAALRGVEAYAHGLRSYQEADVRGILVQLTRKSELLERVRRDIQYKALMDIWLYVHVPATFALLAALVAHILAVFFYW